MIFVYTPLRRLFYPGTQKTRSRVLLVLGITLSHFVIGLGFFIWSFQVSSDAFDGSSVSWLGRHTAHRASEFLWFPAQQVMVKLHELGIGLSGMVQWIPLVLNSLLWGLVLSAIWSRLRALK